MTAVDQLGIALFNNLESVAIADQHGIRFADKLDDAFDPATLYLTNMSAEIGFLPISEEQQKRLLNERALSVRPSALAQDLGWPSHVSDGEIELKTSILSAIRQGYLSAIFRAGITVSELVMMNPSEFLNLIYSRTMPKDYRGEAWPDITLSERTAEIHAWVRTGLEPPAGHRIRTLSVNRSVFYNACLSQPIPTGLWEQGAPSATQAMILGNMSESQGVLVKGKLEPPQNLAFLPSCTTIEDRDCYIAHEVASIEEEGGHLRIADWWSGPLTAVKHPLEVHYEASLGDAILLEIVHRSWRKNTETGYWLACTERLMLHGIAEALNAAGIKILGYGSGRITIATPSNADDEAQQDKILSDYIRPLALQIPINSNWTPEDIKWRLPMLSYMQRYFLCGNDVMPNLDKAIDSAEQSQIDSVQVQAKQAFQALFDGAL